VGVCGGLVVVVDASCADPRLCRSQPNTPRSRGSRSPHATTHQVVFMHYPAGWCLR